MPSHRLKNLIIDDIEITGYSVAGEETVIAFPQLDVCFDIGKAPEQVIPINHLLISHGHIDHTAGIAYYLSHRQFSGISPGRVFLPENLVVPIRQMLDTWAGIDGNAIPGELIGVKPGDEYQIKPNLFIRIFKTRHCYGSVGYTVIEKRKKLKPKYHGLDANELVELKKQGKTIDAPIEIPIVSYLGDTQYDDYYKLDYVAKSKILLAECTFSDEEHNSKAEAGKHMHIDQLVKLLEKCQNQHVIIIHLSQRTSIRNVKNLLKSKIPPQLSEKIKIFMDQPIKKRPSTK